MLLALSREGALDDTRVFSPVGNRGRFSYLMILLMEKSKPKQEPPQLGLFG
jgi:hypothetical protein